VTKKKTKWDPFWTIHYSY